MKSGASATVAKERLEPTVERRPPRIAWLYTSDHRDNPILLQALETMVRAGAETRVYDLAVRPAAAVGYTHVPAADLPLVPRGVSTLGVRGAFQLLLMVVRAARWRPDVVLASEPDGGCLAWLATTLRGAPLVYYPFELYGEEFNRPQTLRTRLMRRMERALLRRRVDAVLTQNGARAAVYRDERGSRVVPVLVQNFKRRSRHAPSPGLKQRLGVGEGERVVLYEGVLQPGRCLENLIRAAGMFPPGASLALMGRESAYAREVLMPLAERASPGRVRFLPGVPHDELLPLVAGADVGVVAYESSGRNNLFCAPGKLSDYVNAGVPMIASDLPTLSPIIEQFGIGASFGNDSPADMAAAVARILERPRGEWSASLDRAREHLAWETQEGALRDAVLGSIDRWKGR